MWISNAGTILYLLSENHRVSQGNDNNSTHIRFQIYASGTRLSQFLILCGGIVTVPCRNFKLQAFDIVFACGILPNSNAATVSYNVLKRILVGEIIWTPLVYLPICKAAFLIRIKAFIFYYKEKVNTYFYLRNKF